MRCFLAVLLMCIPGVASAERVVVRSGEHADFSRLAFDYSGPVVWKMGRTPDGYEIRIDREDVTFDISSIYRRISKDRIKSIRISQDSKRVYLSLGCECYADAFEFRPGLLVVDVKDGSPPQDSGFETAFNTGEVSGAPPANTHGQAEDNGDQSQSSLDDRASRDSKGIIPIFNPAPKEAADPRVGVFAATHRVQNEDSTTEIAERISEMQSEMLFQIGRAASQGLLEADIIPHPEAESPRAVSSETNIEEAGTEPNADIEPHINIHIETSVDRAFGAAFPTNRMTDTGGECLSDELLNVTEWGNPEDVIEQITVQRGAISGEFDKPDAQAVEGLVKANIYAGFGVEAYASISAFDVSLRDADILAAMAQTVDLGMTKRASRLDGQAGCGTSAALWSVLAAPALSKAIRINEESVIRAFSRLPPHLRRRLGPSLAKKFIDIGDIETARALRNALARVAENAGSDLRFLDARLDQARGLHNVAEQNLEQIVSEDSAVAPIALAELLEAKLEQNSEINMALLDQAETYVFEQRNTQISVNLQRLVALAKSQLGDLPAAVATLREIDGSEFMDAKQVKNTWEAFLDNAVNKGGDDVFLLFIFEAQQDLEKQPIARNYRRDAAIRLIGLGFPAMAKKTLAASAEPTADDRKILAHVALLDSDPDLAVRLVKTVEDNEAEMIRARAAEMKGGHTDIVSSIAPPSEHVPNSAPDTEHVLQQDRLLLESSISERQQIERLLEEPS